MEIFGGLLDLYNPTNICTHARSHVIPNECADWWPLLEYMLL